MPRILIVEDEGVVAMDLEARLTRLGHEIVAVTDTAPEAIELARRHQPHLTLMDVYLAGPMEGTQAAAVIRSQVDCPVVYVTGSSDPATIARIQSTSPYGYIRKPFDDRELLSTVDLALHQHALERKLRESEAQFRAVFETSPDAIVLADEEGRVTGWNPGAQALFQYCPAEILGQPLTQLMPDKYRDHHRQMMKQTAQAQRLPTLHAVELDGLRRDGVVFPIELSLGAWQREGRTYYNAIIRDVSARKQIQVDLAEARDRLEQALQETRRLAHSAQAANELKGQILANTSHELRTPLTAIIGSLGLLMDGLCGTPEEQRYFLRSAYTASRALLDLINNLLNQARIETQHMEVVCNVIELAPIVDELLAEFQSAAADKRLPLQVECSAPELPRIWADPWWVQQILSNLLKNAIKFTEHGRITLRVLLDAPWVQIQVVDTGIGVTPDKQLQVFKPFEQADGSATRVYGGTGLGLSISRYMAEIMGGQLTLFSAGSGQGTTLTLSVLADHPDRVGASPV